MWFRGERTRVGDEGVVEGHGDGAARPDGEEALRCLGPVHGVDAHPRLPACHVTTGVHALACVGWAKHLFKIKIDHRKLNST